jgi:Holliday junction resolvasome RuvABC endonuclease subunit
VANVLGLDLGRRVGFALAGPSYLVGWRPRSALEGARPSNTGLTYGEWRLGDEAAPKARFGALWRRLDDLHAVSPLSLVAWEGTSAYFKSQDAALSILGITGVVLAWCHVNGVEDHKCQNNSVKKHAAGHGRAEKSDMLVAAARLGWTPGSDNVADALFVLDLALTQWHARS